MKKKSVLLCAVSMAAALLAGSVFTGVLAETGDSVPHMSYSEFPRIDGSLACVPMIEALAQKATGCTEEEAEQEILDDFLS